MATTLDLVGEKTPEIEGKMRIDRVEEVELMVAKEVIEKTEGVTVETVEEGIMGTPEPINTIMEEATTTADQGKAHEESARGPQANGSFL